MRILGNIGLVVRGLIVEKERPLVHAGAYTTLILVRGNHPIWYNMEVVADISRMIEIIVILSHVV